MIIACEMMNQDGTRTDGSERISMRVWNVTDPLHKRKVYETEQIYYIDAGTWCFDSPIKDPKNQSYLIIFENHEDIEGSDNLLVIGMIEPEQISSESKDYALVGAGQTIVGEAKKTQDGMRIRNRDGKDIFIKKRG